MLLALPFKDPFACTILLSGEEVIAVLAGLGEEFLVPSASPPLMFDSAFRRRFGWGRVDRPVGLASSSSKYPGLDWRRRRRPLNVVKAVVSCAVELGSVIILLWLLGWAEMIVLVEGLVFGMDGWSEVTEGYVRTMSSARTVASWQTGKAAELSTCG